MSNLNSRKQILIQISTRSIIISSVRPYSILHRSEFELSRIPAEWIQQIGELGAEAQERLDLGALKGLPAIVLYQSPTLTCHVSCLTTSNRVQAERAARLACSVSTHHGLSDSVNNAVLLGTDRHEGADRCHLMAAADRVDIVEALSALVESLGLRVEAIVPVEGVITSTVIGAALDSGGEVFGCLYIGQTYSCLVVSKDGELLLFRQVGITTEQLVEAMTLPIVLDAESGRTIELEHAEAEQIICAFGVPQRDDVIDEARGIFGYHVLSAIQSHLQRAAVEIKQSLRFGLPGEVRESLHLRATGTGRYIPQLTEALATLLDVDLIRDAIEATIQVSSHAPLDARILAESEDEHSGSDRATQNTSANRAIRLNLIPPTVHRRHFESRFRRGLWFGLAAGLAILVADGAQFSARARKSAVQLAVLEQQRDQQIEARSNRDEMIALNSDLADLEQAVRQYGRDVVDWAAVLVEFSRIEGNGEIRLASIRTDRSTENATTEYQIEIDAYALGSDDQGQIRRCAQSLASSPLFREVRIGDVEPGELFGTPMRRFTLEIALQPFEVVDPKESASLSSVVGSTEER